MKTQTLYRMYDKDDALLYVGITQRRMERFRQHAEQKRWWSEIARIDIQHFPDRAAVSEAERAAIAAEHPRYNVVWNDRRWEPERPLPRKVRDGYGYGAPSRDRWRPESMTCTVLRRRGALQSEPLTTELVLWWEIDYETITDDYLPSEVDCFELFDQWDRRLRQKGRSELPIWWFVVGPRICEYAIADEKAPTSGHFADFYYLGDATGSYQMDVDVLPVAEKKWTDGQGDKGGFIQQATGWHPIPLQDSVQLDFLRRRMWARRG